MSDKNYQGIKKILRDEGYYEEYIPKMKTKAIVDAKGTPYAQIAEEGVEVFFRWNVEAVFEATGLMSFCKEKDIPVKVTEDYKPDTINLLKETQRKIESSLEILSEEI